VSTVPFQKLWEKVVGTAQLEKHDPGLTYRPAVAADDAALPTLMGDAASPTALAAAVASSETLPVGATALPAVSPGASPPGATATPTTLPGVAAALARSSAAPYLRLEELGRGGMGVVYRARQVSLSREVALKQLLPEARTPQSQRSFISEALVAGLFDHPNIVTVHDLGVNADGEIYLSMKLVDGISWDHLLHPRTAEQRDKVAAMGLPEHLGLLLAVCNAIAFAHSKGFCHNDLKPENVMVGDYGEVLVMDWGLAVDFRDHTRAEEGSLRSALELAAEGGDGTARPLHRTAITQPCGTPSYMPPELAAGHGHRIGPWTDIYLLGAILFELLTGQPPHKRPGGLLAALESALESLPPVFPDSVPAELAEICTRAMARIPEERFASVLELRDALRRYLKHRESTLIADRAVTTLSGCERSLETLSTRAAEDPASESERLALYAGFAEAVAGFQQALLLWDGNQRAHLGLHQARHAYAETALQSGDLGLAEAQALGLDADQPATRELQARIEAAHEERARLREEAVRAQRAELEQREATLRALATARQNLSQVFLEKADRNLERNELLFAQLHLAQALSLDERPDTRRRLLLCRQQGAELCWTGPSQPGAQGLAFSPDGRWLATVSDDDTVRLWEVQSGREVMSFAGHEDCVMAVAFAPEGPLVASGADDRTVRLWSTARGPEGKAGTRVLYGHEAAVRAVAFRPLAAGAGDGHGDGLWLASADRRAIWLWNASTGEVRYVVSVPGVEVQSIAWLADGSGLVSAGSDGLCRVWDVARGQVAAILSGARSALVQVAVAPRRAGEEVTPGTIAAVSTQGTVLLWDLPSPWPPPPTASVANVQGRPLDAGAVPVRRVAHDPRGPRLAMALAGGAVEVRELGGGDGRPVLAATVPGGDEVRELAFAPDGHWLAVATQGRSFGLIPTPGPALAPTRAPVEPAALAEPQVRFTTGHGEALGVLCVSPDGRWLASAGLEPAVWLWDTGSGRPRTRLDAHTRPVRALSISPSGQRLASAGDDGKLVLWSVPDGKKETELRSGGPRLRACAFAGEATLLCYDALGRLERLPTGGGAPLWSIRAPDGSARALALSPDGTQVALAASDCTVRIHDVQSGRELRVIEGHQEWVRGLVFSPDGRRLYTTAVDHAVRIVDLDPADLDPAVESDAAGSGSDNGDAAPELRVLWQHGHDLRGLSLSPDGRRMAVGSANRTVHVIDTEAGRELCMLWGHERGVRALAFDKGGERLYSGGDDRAIKAWRVHASRELFTLRAHEASVRNVVFSPDGKSLASSSGDNTIRLFSTITGAEQQTLRGHTRSVYGLSFTPDGEQVISASFDESMRIWDLAKARVVATFGGKNGGIRSLGLHPRGDLLALGCGDWRVRVVELPSGNERWVLEGHRTQVTCAAFTPDGSTLVTAGRDGTLRRWSMITGEAAGVVGAHDEPIYDAAISPDGLRVASASADGTVALWELSSWTRLATLRDHRGGVAGVAFDRSGQRLASGGDDLLVRVWDLARGQVMLRLAGHDGSVRKVAFSPDGERLASGAGDGTVRLWDLRHTAGDAAQPGSAAPELSGDEPATDVLARLQETTGYRVSGLELLPVPQNHLRPTPDRG
jgi:WD40 repeat protein/serine/threonine protein kinase